ncbi:SRPBCC family protein [Candidatus Poriferisodalis sp.]|uniref:SRPBCC family protein n=1 Tax=Candidatus Poriferisodalis sp. TaxID=3101277 RepID=UPI003B5A2A92
MARSEQRSVSVERHIAAPAEAIFTVLADASRHCEIDGSGRLVRATSSNIPLTLGSTFSMRVRLGVTYPTKNRVLEFEENRLIAWAHWQGQRWRYELEPSDDGGTLVRETFEWGTARWPRSIELAGAHKKNVLSMEVTLERLAAIVETPPAATPDTDADNAA